MNSTTEQLIHESLPTKPKISEHIYIYIIHCHPIMLIHTHMFENMHMCHLQSWVHTNMPHTVTRPPREESGVICWIFSSRLSRDIRSSRPANWHGKENPALAQVNSDQTTGLEQGLAKPSRQGSQITWVSHKMVSRYFKAQVYEFYHQGSFLHREAGVAVWKACGLGELQHSSPYNQKLLPVISKSCPVYFQSIPYASCIASGFWIDTSLPVWSCVSAHKSQEGSSQCKSNVPLYHWLEFVISYHVI